jgi:hypothetical protein
MRTTGLTLTVDKAELLSKLQENQAKHRQVFLDALAGYRVKCEEKLTEHLEMLRKGKTPGLSLFMSRPEDHTKDYDRIIGMVKMDVNDVFELDENSYSQYVMDDWAWKRDWLDTSTAYAAESVADVYGVS